MSKYFFDKQAAEKSVGFIETFVSHTKGELTGKPFILEDFQKEMIQNIFGWKNKKTGFRKYKTVFIFCPEKTERQLFVRR